MHGDIQIAEHIFSIKHPVPLLHIHKFDRENVGGIFQLLRSQNQRRMVLRLAPPLHSACNHAQGSKRRIPQNAEQIQIRIFRMKFPLSRGAVENHAYEVLARCRPHLLNKFAEQLLVRHYSSLPASQASKTSAAAKSAVKAIAGVVSEILSADRNSQDEDDHNNAQGHAGHTEYPYWQLVPILKLLQ